MYEKKCEYEKRCRGAYMCCTKNYKCNRNNQCQHKDMFKEYFSDTSSPAKDYSLVEIKKDLDEFMLIYNNKLVNINLQN